MPATNLTYWLIDPVTKVSQSYLGGTKQKKKNVPVKAIKMCMFTSRLYCIIDMQPFYAVC